MWNISSTQIDCINKHHKLNIFSAKYLLLNTLYLLKKKVFVFQEFKMKLLIIICAIAITESKPQTDQSNLQFEGCFQLNVLSEFCRYVIASKPSLMCIQSKWGGGAGAGSNNGKQEKYFVLISLQCGRSKTYS